jgi:hypothetical protein
MKKLVFLFLLLTVIIKADLYSQDQTPVNQVFQFMHSGICTAWSDSSKTSATVYLWIPENCKRIRGLLILCANVPEHGLVGHPAIRKTCVENNLGIVWSVPSFMNFRKSTSKENKTMNMALEHRTTVNFLQQLLNGLAQTSGYEEVATVPWLPMGESGHLLMVDALMDYSPERCIAGIWIKNNHFPPLNRQTPALVIYGTSQEWGQDKVDIRNRWNNIGKEYERVIDLRKENPNWPVSYLIDGHSGHFDCSERITRYLARYIDLAAKARLSSDNSNTLKPVVLNKGFLADLPVPGHENHPVQQWSETTPESNLFPWFFDKGSAKEAQSIAAINWKAQTQLPAWLDNQGDVIPFNFNGLTSITPLDFEADGITFAIHPTVLDQLPSNFVGAGEKLPKVKELPAVEWICGPIAPLGNGRFRIALDRTWPSSATYIALRQKGNDTIRAIVEPSGINLKGARNTEGSPQMITFEKIPDIKVGTKWQALTARSDSGLPVEFFVVAGPAKIENGRIVFTKIPPRTKYPVAVTIGAWQWGSTTEPKVRTAEIAYQRFNILKFNTNIYKIH